MTKFPEGDTVGLSTAEFRTGAERTTVESAKRLARIAGLLYLLVAIFGGFAQGFLYPKIYVAGDAAKTTGNLAANSGLVRIGVVSDLFQATVWVFVAIVLYRLLRHVNKSVASAMVVLAAMGASITMLNALFEFEALRVATGAVNLGVLGAAGSSGLSLLLVDAQYYGLLIAGIFMGLWLAPMGYLTYRSGLFPKPLGVALVVATGCYLVATFAAFLVPGVSKGVLAIITIPSVIAEVWVVGYLLVVGVRAAKPGEHVLPGTVTLRAAAPGWAAKP